MFVAYIGIVLKLRYSQWPERFAPAPIKVFRNDGKEITSNLVSIRFYLWNAGNAAIHRDDVLRNLTITLDDEDSEILDFLFLKISRDVTDLKLQRNPADSLHSLLLSFSILEQNDGATGQIIYEGPLNSKLRIKGVIEGVKEFTSASEVQSSGFWREYRKKLINFFVVVVILSFLSAIFIFNEKILSQKTKYIRLHKFLEELLGSVISIVIIFLLFTLFYGLIIGPISKAKEDALKNAVQSAPTEILPEK